MKKIYTLLAAAAVAMSASAAEPAAKLYMIGGPNAWNPNEGVECTPTGEAGVFTLTVSFDATTWFGLTSQLGATADDWDVCNAHRYAPAIDAILNEGPNPMVMYNSLPNDRSFNMPAGDYTLTINTKDMILTVGGEVVVEMGDLYLRGDMNGWLNDGLDEAYKFTTTDNNVYTLQVPEIEGGVPFAIANSDYSFKFIVSADNAEGDEEEVNMHLVLDRLYYTTKAQYDMAMEETCENVLITLNIADETVIFTQGDAGVKNVEVAEAGEAVYYNLQGVRVANPEKGLFIQVKGGKAAKVVL